MPHYKILRPCAYLVDGEPVYHKAPGTVVELTADQARILEHRVALVDTGPRGQAAPNSKPAAAKTATPEKEGNQP